MLSCRLRRPLNLKKFSFSESKMIKRLTLTDYLRVSLHPLSMRHSAILNTSNININTSINIGHLQNGQLGVVLEDFRW